LRLIILILLIIKFKIINLNFINSFHYYITPKSSKKGSKLTKSSKSSKKGSKLTKSSKSSKKGSKLTKSSKKVPNWQSHLKKVNTNYLRFFNKLNIIINFDYYSNYLLYIDELETKIKSSLYLINKMQALHVKT
jgi:hypothetical protein